MRRGARGRIFSGLPVSDHLGTSQRRRRICVVARLVESGEAAGVREAPFRADAGHSGFVGARVDEILVRSLEPRVLDDLVWRGAQRSFETLLHELPRVFVVARLVSEWC